ncbi:class II 3-deoxy-7-phosphoheptulonate synthase [Aureliella helgolandensis]|uniref:Phospho-2-dehydro-3-deoxyheptonate aldolase n=1 Tax=Aureliella helgolandensis TaxID=2527968 RepID=A0A518G3I5_9BACT|nr:3-deoxy-7-phosphoheptulonate synthase class II [Aureliella helgolandensis]QDV23161.1 Phospho-2-dehydro-3-deoxyheptonate aldolase [Aureliella helgolandensis]
MPANWNIDSWKSRPASQQPSYLDPQELNEVLAALRLLPPLVTSWEVDSLKQQLAKAQAGEAWLLQGGDCAESLDDCQSESIASKLKVLLQMSLVLIFGSGQRIVRLGRIAGQYAKPRSSDTESRDGQTLPSYRGDLINRAPFSTDHRRNDPQLLLRGYERSALTLNFIRALSEGGFADLHHTENWKLTFVEDRPEFERYRELVNSLGDALKFIDAISAKPIAELGRVDFFTSHEALHLDYEQSLTRESVRGTGWYNLGTHFPWIGERTRSITGAHVEMLRGIRNPIGIKIGPTAKPEEVVDLVRLLNPENEPGRVTLIHRVGQGKVETILPALIEAIQDCRSQVLWVCDPMHGNTVSTTSGQKTRRFDDVLAELRSAFAVHRSCGSRLGGVHLELTGEDVTECVGGSSGLTEDDLHTAYNTHCDPRLNYEQAMEIAFSIANEIKPF